MLRISSFLRRWVSPLTHLGDLYDNERYRVVHKLGTGGFSTVWLAYDSLSSGWVSLKTVLADKSPVVEAKAAMCQNITSDLHDTVFVTFKRYFHIRGPNGRHLCLVQPLMGPSSYVVSLYMKSRIHPRLARRVASQVTKAVGILHSRGICHGDLTPSNIVFRLRNLDHLNEQGIYRLFGEPFTGPLQTTSDESPGPEAPKYIVGYLNFLSSDEDILLDDICLIDLDQAFMTSTPPKDTLDTPAGYLAPEVAVGQAAGPASDIWALGCTLLHVRAGFSPFFIIEVDCPVDLIKDLYQYFGDLPISWWELLFDDEGFPTVDSTTGVPFARFDEKKSLRAWVGQIWDRSPELDAMQSNSSPETHVRDENTPYPACYDTKFWKPAAIKINDVYLSGFNDEVDEIIERIPKISTHEVDLLYNLISKTFVYEPKRQPSIGEILAHPWFHMDEERKRKRDD